MSVRPVTFSMRIAALALAATALAADSLAAGTFDFAGKSRSKLLSSQFSVLDGRASQQYSHSDRLRPDAGKGGIPAYSGSYRGPYVALAKAAARKYGVPEDLFLRLVERESRFNPAATSVKGAIGLAQLMPETAAHLGVDPYDPAQNLDGGARYLRQQYEAFGSWRLALAAYNAGPDAVSQHNGVPPFAETQDYVKAILGA